jgi:hypothetical protein
MGWSSVLSDLVLFVTTSDTSESGEEAKLVPWVNPAGVGITAHF